MRLLAITDTHGTLDVLEHAIGSAGSIDAILFLGDAGSSRSAIRRVYERLSSAQVPVFVIHGNHEDEDQARAIARDVGLTFIHRSVERIGPISIIGYGGDGFSEERADLDAFVNELEDEVSALVHRSIIMTHAPPYGTVLDELDGESTGDRSVRRLIERVKPLIALSGHLHENFNLGGVLGDSIIANPGETGTLLIVNETKQGFAVSLKRL